MFIEIKCNACENKFERNTDINENLALAVGRDPANPLCFACALRTLTSGHAAEEGDLNSASLISGEIDEIGLRWLQEDLLAIEEGRSIREYDDDTFEGDDYVDPAWCYKCNRDSAFCLCICYNCYEDLTDCECQCALCDAKVPGSSLCEEHLSSWDEQRQGPVPSRGDTDSCKSCGFTFNSAWDLKLEQNIRHLIPHKRDTCLICHENKQQNEREFRDFKIFTLRWWKLCLEQIRTK